MLRWIPTALLVVISASLAAADAPRPNVVLIVSDDHGWADYGFMGHPHVRTPHLDRLAAQSLTFRHGRVPSSLCCPSLAALLTGLYPHQSKITSNDPPKPPGKPPAQLAKDPDYLALRRRMVDRITAVPTLPRLLQAQGYVSLQTGKWWQGEHRLGGFTHGMTHGDPARGGRHGDAGLAIGRDTMQPIFDFATQARKDGKPFLVWYAPMLPHQPHNPPARLFDRYRGKTDSLFVAKYWAMVEWFDETCGQLLDFLDRQGLAENTIVVYVTDNGWTQDPAANRPVRSKLSPYDAGLRTPILVRWPGRVKPRFDDTPVSSIDIAPTLLHALGLTPPAGMTGVDLLDAAAVAARPAVFGECFTHDAVDIDAPASSLRWRWVVEGGWKLIVPHPRNERTAAPELYNIAADPREETNRAMAEPDRVRRMQARLDGWWKP